MKGLKTVFAIVAVSCHLVCYGGSTAAKLTEGTGGNSSVGGGNTPPDYGDLIVLYRNDTGVPYITEETQVEDLDTGEKVTGGLCQQPLPNSSCPEECIVDGYAPDQDVQQDVIDVDPLTCSVPIECSMCVSEVEFERNNVIRAGDSVLAQQLTDATLKLATAGCVTLDPAGRPVASTLVDSVVISSTIDSPLQNLAFYKQLMTYGYVGDPPDNDIYLDLTDVLTSAARALGASGPKEGEVTVDQVVYINQILGLTEDGPCILDRIDIDVREEVKGVMKVVKKSFLDYTGFEYDRQSNFSTDEQSLPNPAYIPDNYSYGQFEYLAKVGEGSYILKQAPIIDTVFDQPVAGGNSLTGFTQAADDTRAVINFMHEFAVPDEDVTPIPCNATISNFYDVSISEHSGLEVPVRMAAAGDGREGSLTVVNDGPATADKVEISLVGEYTGIDGSAQTVLLFDEMGGNAIFEDGSAIEVGPIDPGYSVIIDFFFSMDQEAMITWTANVAYDDLDINWDNNTVTESTKVLLPKGKGGSDED